MKHIEDKVIGEIDRLDRKYVRGTSLTNIDRIAFLMALEHAWPILRRLAMEAHKLRDQFGATADT